MHRLPDDTTVLDLVRAGLPAALDRGTDALRGPATLLDQVRLLPPLEAPTVRDFVAFEEHVEGGTCCPTWAGRSRTRSRTRPAAPGSAPPGPARGCASEPSPERERPVPHYWEHVLWVWGHTDLDEFIADWVADTFAATR